MRFEVSPDGKLTYDAYICDESFAKIQTARIRGDVVKTYCIDDGFVVWTGPHGTVIAFHTNPPVGRGDGKHATRFYDLLERAIHKRLTGE